MSEAYARPGQLPDGIGDDPYKYTTRLYTQFLQGWFNFQPANQFHWEPDTERTEIIISAEAPLDSEVVDKHPSLVVILGPIQWAGLGINNMQAYSVRTGTTRRTDLMSGFFIVYCLARNDVIAMRLAHLVSQGTRSQQPLLEGPGGFHQIARPAPSINTPSPPGALVTGDPQNLVMVQVNIPFHFQYSCDETPSRAMPQLRDIAAITEKDRAVDYDYSSPMRVERVKLAISTTPVLVRRIRGGSASRPTTVEVGTGIRNFQVTDLLPDPPDEE